MARTVMMQIDGKVIPVELNTTKDGRIEAGWKWFPPLIDEIKTCMEDRKWNGDKKLWHFADSHHNQFRLQVLMGMNPYERYDLPLKEVTSKRSLFKHQLQLKAHGLTRRQCIFASEPGCGKSLAAIEVAEDSGYKDWFWVAPKAALLSVQLEARKWNSSVDFRFLTYEGLSSLIAKWEPGKKPPHGIIFDESSRLKTHDTIRTKSAQYLADQMRKEWGDEAYVILMTGTPAPQSPLDWFSQARIARPGFLKEGSIWAFKERISKWEQTEAARGGTFPKLIGWYDDPKKCKTCLQMPADVIHTYAEHPQFHQYQPSENEVANLYKRMQGLVIVQKKKDCLDLPEKIFRRLQANIPAAMLRTAKMITKTAGVGSKALTLLRSLSDGFQYKEVAVGEEDCDLCNATGSISDMVYIGPETTDEFMQSLGLTPQVDIVDPVNFPQYWEMQHVQCNKCKGTKLQPKMARDATYVGSPKDELFNDLLEEYDEVGRLVVYGAFQASIDKIVKMVEAAGWDYIKADGRSWASSMPGNPMGWLAEFENRKSTVKKICFIGQPEAAGMGLTLTAACAAVFYSNSFNGESRLQAIERIHRTGASKERGVTIIDLIGLPTDLYVLDRLEKKEDLQAVTLGSLEECITQAETETTNAGERTS